MTVEQPDNHEVFDVVVVGGGPAGSSAAYTAVKAGLRTCVIDKRVFPRDKLCGGLITPRTKNLFREIFQRPWDEDLFLSSDHVSFYSDGQHLASLDGYCTLHFSMRREFDAYLLSLAAAAGASLRLGSGVQTVDMERQCVREPGGARVGYRVLIGADGVSSLVARTLYGSPFDQDTIGFGLEIEVPRDAMPHQADTVEIDFGAARWGYGWVFPKRESFTIGVGGIHKLNGDLRERFAAYLALKGLDIANFKVKGQYIPFGDYRQQPGRSNVLLCGDAAGVVDPITGEGIAYALQTGRAAAQAAASAIEQRDPSKAFSFYRDGYSRVTGDIKQANMWRWLIFPPALRRPFGWAFADAGTLQRGYLDILAGKHGYHALYRLLALQAVKAVRKIARRV